MNGIRRSQIHRWHVQHGASFEKHSDASFVSVYSDWRAECEMARQLGICDLSLLPRNGFKGRGAGDWLADLAVLPEQPNLATGQPGGSLIARLSHEEFLITDDPGAADSLVRTLDDRFATDKPSATYPLPRADSHCLFALCGADAAVTLAKLCAVDMRPERFERGAIAQTSVARLNAIVVRTCADATPVFYLLADVSAAEYLWDCVLDAMAEFTAGAVGITALRALMESN